MLIYKYNIDNYSFMFVEKTLMLVYTAWNVRN